MGQNDLVNEGFVMRIESFSNKRVQDRIIAVREPKPLNKELSVRQRADGFAKLLYKELIEKLISKIREVKGKTKPNYPPAINTSGKQALYDKLEKDEELVLAVYDAVVTYAKHGWRDNSVPAKMKQVRKAVRYALPGKDDEKISEIMSIISAQKEY